MTQLEVRTHEERPIDADDVLRLYAAEGWWPERVRSEVAAVIEMGPAVGHGSVTDWSASLGR